METYNYEKAVLADTVTAIVDCFNYNEVDMSEFSDIDELKQHLRDYLWDNDNVTGNGAFGYCSDNYTLQEYLFCNIPLLEEAVEEFGEDIETAFEKGLAYCDTTIRCYLFDSAVEKAVDELIETIPSFQKLQGRIKIEYPRIANYEFVIDKENSELNYDYRSAVKEDLKEFIAERYDCGEIDFSEFSDLQDARNYIFDIAWTADGVTGNANGSYTCNSYKAASYLCHNFDLLQEAVSVCGSEGIKDAESADVTIRCYLLDEMLEEAIEELTDEIPVIGKLKQYDNGEITIDEYLAFIEEEKSNSKFVTEH